MSISKNLIFDTKFVKYSRAGSGSTPSYVSAYVDNTSSIFNKIEAGDTIQQSDIDTAAIPDMRLGNTGASWVAWNYIPTNKTLRHLWLHLPPSQLARYRTVNKANVTKFKITFLVANTTGWDQGDLWAIDPSRMLFMGMGQSLTNHNAADPTTTSNPFAGHILYNKLKDVYNPFHQNEFSTSAFNLADIALGSPLSNSAAQAHLTSEGFTGTATNYFQSDYDRWQSAGWSNNGVPYVDSADTTLYDKQWTNPINSNNFNSKYDFTISSNSQTAFTVGGNDYYYVSAEYDINLATGTRTMDKLLNKWIDGIQGDANYQMSEGLLLNWEQTSSLGSQILGVYGEMTYTGNLPVPQTVDVSTSFINVSVPSVEVVTNPCDLVDPKNKINPVNNDRLINLVDFLPENYQGTQVSEFMKFFEDFLNFKLYKQAYDNVCDEQFISILKKIELLFTLRDPDLIDFKLLQQLGSYLGYTFSYSRTDIGDIVGDELYVNEYLRSTIRSLPHWYKLKTTQSSIAMIMYMFGLVSDVHTLWTNDYNEYWKAESPNFEDDLSNTIIPDGYYPTPHFKISINALKSESAYEKELPKVIKLIDSIKPINTVFQGFNISYLFAFTSYINTITTYKVRYTITETITP